MLIVRPTIAGESLRLLAGGELREGAHRVGGPVQRDEEDHQRSHKEDDPGGTHADGGGGQQRPHQENAADTPQLRQAVTHFTYHHHLHSTLIIVLRLLI